jgi:hypothetical protein
VDLVAAALLVVVPVIFNLAFFELGRAFDYPAILREPADTILRRFHAGGSGLVLRWYVLFASALAMIPMAVVVGLAFREGPAVLVIGSIVVGSIAGLVQAIGLARWPFVVPDQARRYVAADGPDLAPTRQAVEVVFATLHRLLGVAIGEHLGYLLTGAWTLLVAGAILATPIVPFWLGLAGVPIGISLIVGALEFVGPYERDGWAFAETLVPIAYIAWSVWLIVLGIALAL